MPAPQPVRKRRPQRRGQILAAALELFHERGYHATGMDEIGAAAGITGPGIYRHFPSKEALLEALVRERGEQLLATLEEVVVDGRPAEAVLDDLVGSFVRGIVADPSLAVVAVYERRTLSDATRAWLDRSERRNIDLWVQTLRAVRPELDAADARVVVSAALNLGVAVCTYRSGLPDDEVAATVHSMVLAALLGDRPRRARASAGSRRTARAAR